MSLKEYRVTIGDELLISAQSFSPNALTSDDSIVILGDCHIHGALSCDTVKGGTMKAPVVLSSGQLDMQSRGSFVFVSPIAGHIASVYMLVSAAATPDFSVGIYNENGVKATTVIEASGLTSLDITDDADASVSFVGEGSSIIISIDNVETNAITAIFSLIIEPFVDGGDYD